MVQVSTPFPLTWPSLSHMQFSQPSSGGASGMNSQSAPEARADTRARYLEERRGHLLRAGPSTWTPDPSHLSLTSFVLPASSPRDTPTPQRTPSVR